VIPNSKEDRSKFRILAANKAATRMSKARKKRAALILQPAAEVGLMRNLSRKRATRSISQPHLGEVLFPARW